MVQDYAPENPVVPVRWAGLLLKFGLKFTEPIKSLGELADVMANYSATPVLDAVADGLEQGIKDGRIPPGRMESPELRTAIAELVRDLESEIPDERRFEVLRRAVVSTAIGIENDPDGTKALLFVQTARQLRGEQAIVLGAGFRFRRPPGDLTGGHRSNWWEKVAMQDTRIPYRDRFLAICKSLKQLGLMFGTDSDANVYWSSKSSGVLTDYGLDFCEFLERAEPLGEASTGDGGEA